MARRKFAVGTCSDHMTLLRAFQVCFLSVISLAVIVAVNHGTMSTGNNNDDDFFALISSKIELSGATKPRD